MEKNRFLISWRCFFYILLIYALLSCNIAGLIFPGNEEENNSTGVSLTPFLPEGGMPPAPVLTGENVSCVKYVSPAGDDAVEGSESQPWGSFQYAVDMAKPGDTVCFRGGTYVVEDTFHISQSGTDSLPIVFIAYPGERPVLDGAHGVGDLLVLDKFTSHLRISGFTLSNFINWGLSFEGENRHIFLDHLILEGGEAGVHFTYGMDDLAPPEGGLVEYVTLEESLIFNSEYTALDCTPGPCNHMTFRHVEVFGSGLTGESSFGSDGIAISRGYPILIEDCFIHDNGGDGIDLSSRDRGGYANGVIVRRNQVIRNYQNGIKLWAGGRVENNLVWGQGNSALWLGTFHSKLEVVNNTIAFNMWDPVFSERNYAFSTGYQEDVVANPQVELLLVNNIFAFNTGPSVGDPTGLYLGPGVKISEHHNLYFSYESGEITADFLEMEFTRQDLADGTWTDLTGQGQKNLMEDPLFTSGWPKVDLQLQPTSPGVDAGDNAFCPDVDLLGKTRPVDGNKDREVLCDIGAFERYQ